MITIIGVDCAVQPAKTGLALAQYEAARLVVLDTMTGSKQEEPKDIVSRWLSGVESALICLDAPLGWPQPMADELAKHFAGREITTLADRLVRRRTDDVIAEKVGKRPLDVGADRIARTALAALHLLGEVRKTLGQPIPLAWTPGVVHGIQAIEVYPAATRRALGIEGDQGSLVGLEPAFSYALEARRPQSDHAEDAVVCAIAGAHFLEGKVIQPDDKQLELARREGWIWSHPRIQQPNPVLQKRKWTSIP